MPGSYKYPFDPLCAPDILSQLKYLYISEIAESVFVKVIFFLFEFIVSNISSYLIHNIRENTSNEFTNIQNPKKHSKE